MSATIYNLFFSIPEENIRQTTNTAASIGFGRVGDTITPAILEELTFCSAAERADVLSYIKSKHKLH